MKIFDFSTKKEMTNALDQSPDERAIVDYVRSKVEENKQSNSRVSLEGGYLTNTAYLLGFDGVYYDVNYKQFKNSDPKRRLSRGRFKVNKILPTVQNRLSRITKNPPKFDVRPNSNSTEDKDAARLALQILVDNLEKQRFTEKRQELHMSGMQGGVSYLQVLWDPSLGKPMVDPMAGGFSGYEGDIRVEVLNALEVFPDPLAKNIEDCRYIIKAKVRKLDYFRERYPDKGHLVKEEDSWLTSSLYDMKVNSLSSNGLSGGQTQSQQKNSAIEIVYYEKRSKNFPNGRQIAIANGILLEDKELPCGEYNIVKFDDVIVAGRFYSEAIITHLRPIQDQYNVLRARCAEWIRTLFAGKYLVPKGSGLSQESLNDQNGEVIEYNPVTNASPPTALNIPQIPSYIYKDLETLDAEFDFVSGLHEVSQGILPASGMPAQGMAFLQEQDQTRIGVQSSRNEIGYAKVGQLILKYVSEYYEMPRILKIAGEGLEYAVKDFVGADIRGNHDCIVVEGSTLPTSKTVRRNDVINAYTMGLLGNPQDPKVQSKVLSMLEYGDVAEMWKTQALNEARSKKIIEAIEKNDFTYVQGILDVFDNQEFYLMRMDEYRLSEKWEKFSPQQKQFFKYVMEWRLQALANSRNPEMAQQVNQAQLMVNNMEQNPTFGMDAETATIEQSPPAA